MDCSNFLFLFLHFIANYVSRQELLSVSDQYYSSQLISVFLLTNYLAQPLLLGSFVSVNGNKLTYNQVQT